MCIHDGNDINEIHGTFHFCSDKAFEDCESAIRLGDFQTAKATTFPTVPPTD